jgi:hypothetical protein
MPKGNMFFSNQFVLEILLAELSVGLITFTIW